MADRREQMLAAIKELGGDDEETSVDAEEHSEEVVDSGDESDSGTKDAESVEPSPKSDDGKDSGKLGKPSSEKQPSADSAAKEKQTATVKKSADPKADAAKKPVAAAAPEAANQQKPEDVGTPPKSWGAAAREHWAKLPKEVRDDATRREKEMHDFISQNGAAVRHQNEFNAVVGPYQHLIAAQNSTPIKAVQNLMATAARLMTGNAQQQAQTVVEIIRNYNVDIATIDQVLKQSYAQPGSVPQQSQYPAQQHAQPPAWAKPLFDNMMQVQQAQQSYQSRVQQEAQQELEEFQKKEFWNDLQGDIHLMMQIATQRGQRMTLAEAYEKASKLHPQVSAILAQRASANSVSAAAATLAKAKKAASSVRGVSSAGSAANAGAKPNGADKKLSRKDLLSAAFDSAGES